ALKCGSRELFHHCCHSLREKWEANIIQRCHSVENIKVGHGADVPVCWRHSGAGRGDGDAKRR
ncbi:hypothetical protein NPIL_669011, partial [Nephila pilipes]